MKTKERYRVIKMGNEYKINFGSAKKCIHYRDGKCSLHRKFNIDSCIEECLMPEFGCSQFTKGTQREDEAWNQILRNERQYYLNRLQKWTKELSFCRRQIRTFKKLVNSARYRGLEKIK